jgi:hypothetical protein
MENKFCFDVLLVQQLPNTVTVTESLGLRLRNVG